MDYAYLGSRLNQRGYLVSSVRENIKEITFDTAEKLRYLAKRLDRTARAKYIEVIDIDETAEHIIEAVNNLTTKIDEKLRDEFAPKRVPDFCPPPFQPPE